MFFWIACFWNPTRVGSLPMVPYFIKCVIVWKLGVSFDCQFSGYPALTRRAREKERESGLRSTVRTSRTTNGLPRTDQLLTRLSFISVVEMCLQMRFDCQFCRSSYCKEKVNVFVHFVAVRRQKITFLGKSPKSRNTFLKGGGIPPTTA